jgi:hypothetical protein
MFARPVPPRIPELPTDLKCDWRFPRPRRHREQNAGLARDDRFNRAINRDLLIITFPLPQREVLLASERNPSRNFFRWKAQAIPERLLVNGYSRRRLRPLADQGTEDRSQPPSPRSRHARENR